MAYEGDNTTHELASREVAIAILVELRRIAMMLEEISGIEIEYDEIERLR